MTNIQKIMNLNLMSSQQMNLKKTVKQSTENGITAKYDEFEEEVVTKETIEDSGLAVLPVEMQENW